ncbi:serine hydrolase domain-containing protein [Rufibacter immobilis]|uniref:serine hydrolase domain-containing protein n=1 Tax=Rufibacter immobilis TaxID=1348778 RepID=UPI0035E7CDE2
MKIYHLVLVLLVAFPLASRAQQSLNKAKMDSLLTVLEEKNKVMGAVALYQEDQLVYNRAIGYQSIKDGQKTKATTSTKFRVGSISKTFTAVMVMQLVEQKKLTLETPLAKFFPQFENASSITVEHLLTQRSGLKSFTTDPAYSLYLTQPKTQAQMLEIMLAQKSSFAPGTKYEYSNTNYVLLGYIVEKVTKQPYAEVLKNNIVDKLGLKNTYYGAKINSAQQEASSFRFVNDQWTEVPETDMSIPHGAGAVVSTTQDLAKFIQALFQHKLNSEASLTKMISMKDNYGMALTPLPLGPYTGYGHGGVIDGFSAMMSYYPTQKVTMVSTFNGVNTNANDVLVGILSIAFNFPYKIPTYAAPKNLKLDLVKYEGTFSSQQFPLKIVVRKEGEKLVAQATGQGTIDLEARSESEFVFEPAGIVMEFNKSAAGAAYDQFTLKQGGGKFTFTKEQ